MSQHLGLPPRNVATFLVNPDSSSSSNCLHADSRWWDYRLFGLHSRGATDAGTQVCSFGGGVSVTPSFGGGVSVAPSHNGLYCGQTL